MKTRRIHVDLDESAIQRLDALKKTVNFRRRSDVLNLILYTSLDGFEQSIREALTEAVKHPVVLSSRRSTAESKEG